MHLMARELMGIHSLRYAASPAGSSRWQPPQAPAINRNLVLNATTRFPSCPHAGFAGGTLENYNYSGDEDCLFLSVYAPQNATQLPVLVYIREVFYVNYKSINYS